MLQITLDTNNSRVLIVIISFVDIFQDELNWYESFTDVNTELVRFLHV